MPKSLVIAHRGDPSRALENSLEAFRLALSASVDMIEFDVRKSRDNVLYVMHDRETGRTSDRNIDIERADGAKISLIRLRNGEPVPTLDDVLGLVAGRCGLNIELKGKGSGALTATHLKSSRYEGPVLLSSFQEGEVMDAKKILPDIPVAGIFDSFLAANVDNYQRKGYQFISLNRRTVTHELVKLLHECGIMVYVWTVDDERDMNKFISWGVDGIYSNNPLMLKQVVG